MAKYLKIRSFVNRLCSCSSLPAAALQKLRPKSRLPLKKQHPLKKPRHLLKHRKKPRRLKKK